jgi:SRSO17 transposase
VLVVDETGDLKQGGHTVGVGRQDTGTAGKVDNAQVAIDLTDATPAGHGVIDREPPRRGRPRPAHRSRPSPSWPG